MKPATPSAPQAEQLASHVPDTSLPSAAHLFTADEIRRHVGLADLIDPVASVLPAVSRGEGESPIVVFAPHGADGDVHVKSAWLPGADVFIVKVAAAFAARRTEHQGANSGYVAVHSAHTGDLTALLYDEHHLTDVRTAATGAVATRLLSRPDARTAAILGTGAQAYLQALATCEVRSVERLHLWGRHPVAAHRLRAALQRRLPGVTVTVESSVRAAVAEADIIVTATSSREPVLRGEWLRAGQHVTAVGADDATKAELDPHSFARADLVAVESREAAGHHAGDLIAAVRGPAPVEVGLAELGEILGGSARGRQHDREITVAKLVGLGAEDLVAAQVALERLTSSPTPASAPTAPNALDLLAR
jgi:ornithine cyclodeaminase/alanine dehydrogenase-like protein (mu-crystallin family)